MSRADYLVRSWTCACGDRYLAWPEEQIDQFILWHQLMSHGHITRGRYQTWHVVNLQFDEWPETQEVAE